MTDRGHLSDAVLNEYLDGALSASGMAQADEHLRGCGPCASRLSELAEVFAALDNLIDLPLEKDLAPGIVGKLLHRSGFSKRLSWKSTRRLGLALAAEVIGAVALLSLTRPEVVPWLSPEALPNFANAFGPALEEAAVFLTAALSSSDPLGLETLLTSVSIPGIPWASVSSLMTLLAASTVVWLLGNGLLLRRGRLSANRRDL